ncbi:GntR family transcriptional regulator [Pseudovibrio sp. Tun.PSC04-5.I4]|uniref:GntR family transcriptional regulator n=1 Tax=Pseudovibrio sp. Tun.PSC04-5.I4 TaxID=1798213 RepID=UPI00088A96F5|nr:GntR family transcriptional regulator [Pseudovibrio sp. Tun.PSC04-5.I4]SDQ19114.1 DNA-binding transcriptional regulator, GntR family [Pseudovibrio sp. Tun.PSC04-5.I4]
MKKADSNVDRIYEKLRQMAADFEFKPDARINESVLSTELGASRTPLREALNRLVAEGFLTFQSGRGFFCRPLSPKRILDLYEARVAIETEIVRLVCRRASDEELEELMGFLTETEPAYDICEDPIELLRMDEAYHMRIAVLSQSHELQRILENLNDRVRYIRLVDLKYLRGKTPVSKQEEAQLSAHRIVLTALISRDEETAVSTMRHHIERRRDEATEAVRIAYSQLYVPSE